MNSRAKHERLENEMHLEKPNNIINMINVI